MSAWKMLGSLAATIAMFPLLLTHAQEPTVKEKMCSETALRCDPERK